MKKKKSSAGTTPKAVVSSSSNVTSTTAMKIIKKKGKKERKSGTKNVAIGVVKKGYTQGKLTEIRSEAADFADKRPEAFAFFVNNNVKADPTQPGLMKVTLAAGMCRDRHVIDFIECFKAWLKRNNREPYHIKSVDLSKNSLDDASLEKVLAMFQEESIQIDNLYLSGNKMTHGASMALADYLTSVPQAVQAIDIRDNLLEEDELHFILHSIWQHPQYPYDTGRCTFPLRLEITGNPVAQDFLVKVFFFEPFFETLLLYSF